MNSTSLGLAVAGDVISWISLAELARAVAATLSGLGIILASASLVVAFADFIATFTMESPFNISKANLRKHRRLCIQRLHLFFFNYDTGECYPNRFFCLRGLF